MEKKEDEDADLVPSGAELALNVFPLPWIFKLSVVNFKIKEIILLDLS